MRTFGIDLYLWYAPASSWLLIPPYPSTLKWSLKLSQEELLSCEAGLTFRVDEFLWVGNERDLFPLEMILFELENTLNRHFPDGEVVARLPVSEFLAIEIKHDLRGNYLLSRYSTRERNDYFEQVAHFVGTYYENYVIEEKLWREAVNTSLDGLAIVYGTSERSITKVNHEVLARKLLERYHLIKD